MLNSPFTNLSKESNLGSFCAHLFILATLLLSGCAVTPSSVVKTPTTARPDYKVPNPSGGAIYNSAAYRPLFEDRKPRMVGDIVTINITENTAASKDGSSSASKTGSVNGSITASFGSPVPRASFNGSNATSYEDDAAASSSNKFTGAITTTVVEVLPNGYLVVSGEKQIAFDKGTEFVRFSGVVNPDTITLGNNVPSSKVADARIEYRTNSKLDAAQVMNILTRFFLSFVPL